LIMGKLIHKAKTKSLKYLYYIGCVATTQPHHGPARLHCTCKWLVGWWLCGHTSAALPSTEANKHKQKREWEKSQKPKTMICSY
jgi:hypothetical protein